ncbi:MAG: hypothetical protein RR135_01595, partial [Oscillospiraceae bacterium]
DRIAQMLNCPVKGEELRRAVTESRKEFLLAQEKEQALEEVSIPSVIIVPALSFRFDASRRRCV